MDQNRLEDRTPEGSESATRKTLWIDVEDLFDYAAAHKRPSGIQRLSFEIYKALVAHSGNKNIRFLRRTANGSAFYSTSWKSVEDVFSRLVVDTVLIPVKDDRDSLNKSRNIRRMVKRFAPKQSRAPLAGFLNHQMAALRLLKDALWASIATDGDKSLFKPSAANDDYQSAARPGDVLASFGSPWNSTNFSKLIEREQTCRGIHFALLIYDIIPLRCPEFTESQLIFAFDQWLRSTLPLGDTIFAISKATADDLVKFTNEQRIPLKDHPVVIPLGAELSQSKRKSESSQDRPPPKDRYALIVSTIEARKNHELLFRIWRKLLENLPRERVPTLVFAGRVGWLVADLIQKLENTKFLDGKIVIRENPSDGELTRLYENCSFTLFPSFYEGWGLPISESLAFGQPCIASNRTSLPEAGGRFARYFDPDNFQEAYEMVLQAVEDQDEILAWREMIRREFKPVTWSQTARAVLDKLELDEAAT